MRAVAIAGLLLFVVTGCGGGGVRVGSGRQYYSAEVYDSLARRSLPLHELNRRAAGATLQATLTVREADEFEDDYYQRQGKVVILGREGNAFVGFTTRRMVDITYPCEPGSDGSGGQEWREHVLRLDAKGMGSATYRLAELPRDGQVRFQGAEVAFYRAFGDNDAALVYFPVAKGSYFGEQEQVVAPLGLADPSPTEFITHLIANSTNILGFDYLLITRESFREMRAGACNPDDGGITTVVKVAIVLVAAYYFLPALGIEGLGLSGAAGDALLSIVSGGGASGLWAEALPIGVHLAGNWLLDSGHLDAFGPYGKVGMRLLLTKLPGPRTAAGKAVVRFVDSVTQGEKVQAVNFGQSAGAMLMDPRGKLNVNYELVRQGYVQLDLGNDDALDRFPEFVEAAQTALIEGLGDAKGWRDDAQYVDGLRRARAKRTRWR